MDHIWEYVNYVSISVNKMGKHTKCKQCNKEMQALSVQMKCYPKLKITESKKSQACTCKIFRSVNTCHNFSKLGLFTFLLFCGWFKFLNYV